MAPDNPISVALTGRLYLHEIPNRELHAPKSGAARQVGCHLFSGLEPDREKMAREQLDHCRRHQAFLPMSDHSDHFAVAGSALLTAI